MQQITKITEAMPLAPFLHTQDTEDYLVQCGWVRLHHSMPNDNIIYVKANSAIVFNDGTIEYKKRGINDSNAAVEILFRWTMTNFYYGWDGSNMHQLMMLLDFMGAVKIAEVNKLIRGGIVKQHLQQQIESIYPTLTIQTV